MEQGLDQDPKALIPIADVLDTIQRALLLLGSANNTISETRREIALGDAHSSFRKYAKGDFNETGTDLFGEAFKEVLVQKVETDSALSKAVSIANKSAGTKVYQKSQRGRIAESSGSFQSVDTGTGPARPFLHTGTLGRENTSKPEVLQGNQVFSADWAPAKQIDTNLQVNSRINRGSPQGAEASRPAAVLLAGVEQVDPRPFADHRQMQGSGRTSLPVVKEAIGITRFCCQYGDATLQSDPDNRISGVHHRCGDNDLRAPQNRFQYIRLCT